MILMNTVVNLFDPSCIDVQRDSSKMSDCPHFYEFSPTVPELQGSDGSTLYLNKLYTVLYSTSVEKLRGILHDHVASSHYSDPIK